MYAMLNKILWSGIMLVGIIMGILFIPVVILVHTMRAMSGVGKTVTDLMIFYFKNVIEDCVVQMQSKDDE